MTDEHSLLEPKDLKNGVNIIVSDCLYILMVKHNYHDGLWSLPGGGIKQGEITTDAAARELREETGLSVTAALTPVATITMIKSKNAQVHLFEARGLKGQLKADGKEISECRYFSAFELESIYSAEEARSRGFYPAQISFVKTYLYWVRNGKQILYGLPTIPPILKSGL